MWVFTVVSLMKSSWPISAFDSPRAIRRNTSRSRVVRVSTAFGGGQDPPGRLDPVQHGHTDVHQDDVGSRAGRALDRLETVLGLGHDLDVRFLGEQHAQPGPDHRLVIDQQYTD